MNSSERAQVKELRDPDDGSAEARQKQYVQIVSDCMKKQGFSDFTFPKNLFVKQPGIDLDLPVAQYGFGFSTRIEEQYGPEPVDPYYTQLSDPEKKAYDAAWGQCGTEAAETQGPVQGSGVLTGNVGDSVRRAQKRALNDQRLIDANQKWSVCMAGEGFKYPTRADLFNDLGKRSEPFISTYTQAVQGLPSGTKSPALENVLTSPQMQQLEALQDDERKAAIADEKCDGKQLAELQGTITEEYVEKLERDGE